MSDRATFIGYGKKYDIGKGLGNNPAPNNYQKPSLFEINKKKGSGKTFGVSREVYFYIIFVLINIWEWKQLVKE